jgi:hypothetical protein
LREERAGFEEAFDAMALLAVRIQDQDRRRPLDVEALERLRLLLDVSPIGDEVFGDEG